MSELEERWAHLGTAVADRMAWLGMSQADLVRTSGLSAVTVRPFMQGRPTNSRPATMAKIARALEWPPDALARMLDGDPPPEIVTQMRPRTADEPHPGHRVVEIAALAGQLRPDQQQLIEDLIRSFLQQPEDDGVPTS